MHTSNELVLLYSPLIMADAGKLKAVLVQMGARIKHVGPGDTAQTVGHLAGLTGFEANTAPAPAISDPMMVLCGFTSERLDALLKNLRAAGAPRVPYKAVLTEHNCAWPLHALYEELQGERAEIARQQAERRGQA